MTIRSVRGEPSSDRDEPDDGVEEAEGESESSAIVGDDPHAPREYQQVAANVWNPKKEKKENADSGLVRVFSQTRCKSCQLEVNPECLG
jgi:hypothetical protein